MKKRYDPENPSCDACENYCCNDGRANKGGGKGFAGNAAAMAGVAVPEYVDFPGLLWMRRNRDKITRRDQPAFRMRNSLIS